MQLERFLIVLILVFAAVCLKSQTIKENTTLDALLKSIAQNKNISIIYNPKDIKADRQADHILAIINEEQILQSLATYYNLELSRKDNVFLLRAKPLYKVYGYTIDSTHAEVLPFAWIQVIGTDIAHSSNVDGYYNFELPSGEHFLDLSYIGRPPTRIKLSVQSDTKQNLKLNTTSTLPEIIISEEKKKSPFANKASFQHQDLMTIAENTPSVGGSNDLLQTLRMLPGIQSGAGGVGGLSIRGGDNDQNLILLDGVEIFNPFHSLGLTSIFTPETIKDLKVYKDQFHPSYGDRSSSIIDIRLKEATSKQFKINAGINNQDIFLKSDIPLGPESSSLLAYVRTTTAPFQFNKIIQPTLFPFLETQGNISYLDLIIKAKHELHPRHKLYFTLFRTGDRVRGFFEVNEGSNFTKLDGKLSFSNNVINAQLKSMLSKNLFLTTSLNANNYQSDSELFAEGLVDQPPSEFRLFTDVTYNNNNIEGKIDLSYYLKNTVSFKGGMGYSLKSFNSNIIIEDSGLEVLDIDDQESERTPNTQERVNAYKLYQYLSASINNKKVDGFIGVRSTQFRTKNDDFIDIQPRAWLRYIILPKYSISASWSRNIQYIHFISASELSLPRDFWYPSSDELPPERTDHINLGLNFKPSDNFDLSINAFSKKTDNATLGRVIDGTDSNLTGDVIIQGIGVHSGTATSRGLELATRFSGPRYHGIISYTLSSSQRLFDDINLGRPFSFQFDRRHEFKSSVFFNLSKQLSIGYNLYIGSGNPIISTTNFSSLTNPIIDNINNPGELNIIRDSWRYRIDLSMTYRLNNNSFDHFIKLNLYNTTDAPNPLFFSNDFFTRETRPEFSIPFLPSVAYQISF